MQVPVIAVRRQECITPERAQIRLAQMQARESAHAEMGMVSNVHSRVIPDEQDGSPGSVIVTMSYDEFSEDEFSYLLAVEQRSKGFQSLIAGRKVLPGQTSDELGVSTGMLDGLYLGDEE